MFRTLHIISTLAYLAVTFVFLFELAFHNRKLSKWGIWAAWAVLPVHLVGLISDPKAVFSLPNSLSLVAFFLVGGFLILERLYTIRPLGSLVAPLAVCMLAIVLLSDPNLASQMSSFSGFRFAHVSLAFLGTAAYALAFFAAVIHVLQTRHLKKKKFGRLFHVLPSLQQLDTVNYRCIQIGFPLYTAAILFGLVWSVKLDDQLIHASTLLAMVTWVFYGVVLQARLTMGWRGHKAAVVTIVGFVMVVSVVVAYSVR